MKFHRQTISLPDEERHPLGANASSRMRLKNGSSSRGANQSSQGSKFTPPPSQFPAEVETARQPSIRSSSGAPGRAPAGARDSGRDQLPDRLPDQVMVRLLPLVKRM